MHGAGVRVIGDHALHLRAVSVKNKIGDIPFFGEFHALRHTLLPERVQDLIADPVRRIGGAGHRLLAELCGMAAEFALRDMPVRGA